MASWGLESQMEYAVGSLHLLGLCSEAAWAAGGSQDEGRGPDWLFSSHGFCHVAFHKPFTLLSLSFLPCTTGKARPTARLSRKNVPA